MWALLLSFKDLLCNLHATFCYFPLSVGKRRIKPICACRNKSSKVLCACVKYQLNRKTLEIALKTMTFPMCFNIQTLKKGLTVIEQM